MSAIATATTILTIAKTIIPVVSNAVQLAEALIPKTEDGEKTGATKFAFVKEYLSLLAGESDDTKAQLEAIGNGLDAVINSIVAIKNLWKMFGK